MTDPDPAKRVPKAIGTRPKLVGPFTLGDVAIALLPGVLLILAVQLVLPPDATLAGHRLQPLAVPLAGVGIAVGLLFVYLTPAYTSAGAWIAQFLRFRTNPRRLDHEPATHHTHVARVHHDLEAIERTDGALLGVLAVDPPSMALATAADWRRTAEAFANVCNTVVEFPIQLYATTTPFPVAAYLAHFEARLDDADVKANPRLAALIEDYLDWYAAEIDDRRVTIREHYVVVPVADHEVDFDPESHLAKLGRLPLLGLLVRAAFGPGPEERRAALAAALDLRLARLEHALRGIDGLAAHRVSAVDAARLVGEFWTGDALDETDLDRVLRTRPLVGGPP